MEYNNDLLNEIEEFAYVYFTIDEVATVTGADPIDIADPTHEAGLAFKKGRLKRKAEFNGAVISLTKQLSSPAMAIEREIAQASYLNDLRI